MLTDHYDHLYALGQTLLVISFALAPTILVALASLVQVDHPTFQFVWGEAKETFEKGELLMISTSILGPITYLAMTEQGPNMESLLNKKSILYACITILILSSAAYMLIVDEQKVNNIFSVSLYLFIPTVVIYYFVAAYQNVRVPPFDLKKSAQRRAKKLTSGWEK